jgi:hypothetical protein
MKLNAEGKRVVDELVRDSVSVMRRKTLTDVLVATRGYLTRDGSPRKLVSVHVSGDTFKITLGE